MTDLRPIYFAEARARLVGNRLRVYVALSAAPATGTELAAKMGWPVTSVRPRIAELRDMQHAQETGTRRNGEHEWRALTAAETAQIKAEVQWSAGGYVGKQLNLI